MFGNDFRITPGCMNNNNSYDNSPYTYDTEGKKYALNGEKYFKINENELFELILS